MCVFFDGSYKKHKQLCDIFSVNTRFDVKVEWYTGDITTETVIGDDGDNYYFDFDINRSWYAPHSFCRNVC